MLGRPLSEFTRRLTLLYMPGWPRNPNLANRITGRIINSVYSILRSTVVLLGLSVGSPVHRAAKNLRLWWIFSRITAVSSDSVWETSFSSFSRSRGRRLAPNWICPARRVIIDPWLILRSTRRRRNPTFSVRMKKAITGARCPSR